MSRGEGCLEPRRSPWAGGSTLRSLLGAAKRSARRAGAALILALAALALPTEALAGAGDATGQPTISGTAQVAQILTADTSGIDDPDGISGATFAYQWIRVDGDTESDISAATHSTYRLETGDSAKTVKVKVSFTDDAMNAESVTSAAYPSSGTVTTPAGPVPVSGSTNLAGLNLTITFNENLRTAGSARPRDQTS